MLELTIWGSRGSIPTSGVDFQRHGGATTCLEVRYGGGGSNPIHTVIVDGGTGLASLGRERSLTSALILQSHFHWDHIQGYPFFGPFFRPDAAFEFWAVPRDQRRLEEVLGEQMTKPNFPIALCDLPANLRFDAVDAVGTRQHHGCFIHWTEVSHPSGSTAFRFDYGGVSIVVTGDVETRAGCGQRLVDFAMGADVIIMDAQYFPDEYESRKGWGHSTPLDAVGIATLAKAKRLILTHHDPTHTDEDLERKLAIATRVAPPGLVVENAFDGMCLEWALPTFDELSTIERDVPVRPSLPHSITAETR